MLGWSISQGDADQITFHIKKKGILVEYVLCPNEGYGYARPENRIDLNTRAKAFLATHLGRKAKEIEEAEGLIAMFPLLEKEELVAK